MSKVQSNEINNIFQINVLKDDILQQLKSKSIDSTNLKNKKKKQIIVKKISDSNYDLDRFKIIEKVYKDVVEKSKTYLCNNNYENGKIYKITCTTTKKIYIGSTFKTIEERFDEHWENFMENPSRCKLHESFEKYSFDDHYIELIEEYPCSMKLQLTLREDYMILHYDTINNGLNTILNNKIENTIYCNKCNDTQKLSSNIEKCANFKTQKMIVQNYFPKEELNDGETLIFMIKLNDKSYISKTTKSLKYALTYLYDVGLKNINKNIFTNSKFVNELQKNKIYDFEFYKLDIITKEDSAYLSRIVNYYKTKYDTIKNGFNSQ